MDDPTGAAWRHVMFFISCLRIWSPLTSIVLDLAEKLFTPDAPKVFCGLEHFTKPPPAQWWVDNECLITISFFIDQTLLWSITLVDRSGGGRADQTLWGKADWLAAFQTSDPAVGRRVAIGFLSSRRSRRPLPVTWRRRHRYKKERRRTVEFLSGREQWKVLQNNQLWVRRSVFAEHPPTVGVTSAVWDDARAAEALRYLEFIVLRLLPSS